MNLLTNGIESIQVGIEDFQAGSRSRLLSAVRNIHAGILLLYKEALRRASPPDSKEALLKARVVPVRDATGSIVFVGHGTLTVDAQQIREHFGRLGIETDWDRFKRINKVRNEIEHYYTAVSQDALKALVADTFTIVRDFVTRVLDADPRELLGPTTWRVMLEVSEVFSAERGACVAALSEINWESPALESGVLNLDCPACSSALLHPTPATGGYLDIHLTCRACGQAMDSDTFVPLAIAEALAGEMYATKDGGELPYGHCPECGRETYVVEEDRCAFCGCANVERVCQRCGGDIPPNELLTSPLCSWCAHIAAKGD